MSNTDTSVTPAGFVGWGGCGTAACVNPEVVDGGVRVTSTIEGNDGAVVFTHEEWDAFIAQVQEGKWNHTVITNLATV